MQPNILTRGAFWTLKSTISAAAAVGLTPALTPERVLSAASSQTGITDTGASIYREGLEVLCRSLADDAQLTGLGRIAVHGTLVKVAANRLRLQDARRRHPEVFEAPLRPFVVICGLPRSGTTLLHRLLCAPEGVFGPPVWEAQQPVADAVDHRRTAFERLLTVVPLVAPDLARKHANGVDLPDEELFFLDPSFWSPSFWRLAPVHGYRAWWMKQDPTEAYRLYRETLLWLQHQHPGEVLVLKTPNHVGFLRTIHQVLPEARLVQTHRDPVDALPSYCSLLATVHQVHARAPTRELGDPALDLWGTLVDRALRDRVEHGLDVLDVGYAELVADPVATARRVAEHVGIPADDGATRRFLASHPRDPHGRHAYTLEAFELTAERVRSRFAPYISRHAARF